MSAEALPFLCSGSRLLHEVSTIGHRNSCCLAARYVKHQGSMTGRGAKGKSEPGPEPSCFSRSCCSAPCKKSTAQARRHGSSRTRLPWRLWSAPSASAASPSYLHPARFTRASSGPRVLLWEPWPDHSWLQQLSVACPGRCWPVLHTRLPKCGQESTWPVSWAICEEQEI